MDLRAMVDGDLSVIEGGAAPNPMKQHINEGADGPLGVAGAKKKKLKAGGPGSGRKPGDWHNAEVTGPERENWLALLKEVEKRKLTRSPVRPEDQKHLGPTLYSEKKKKRLAAGGPGSGCKGPNCGRHAGGKGTDKTHVPKQATVARTFKDLGSWREGKGTGLYDRGLGSLNIMQRGQHVGSIDQRKDGSYQVWEGAQGKTATQQHIVDTPEELKAIVKQKFGIDVGDHHIQHLNTTGDKLNQFYKKLTSGPVDK